MNSDPVTTAILRETADKLKKIGAPLPLIYRCDYEIDGEKYTISIEIQPDSTIEQEKLKKRGKAFRKQVQGGRNYVLKDSKIIDETERI